MLRLSDTATRSMMAAVLAVLSGSVSPAAHGAEPLVVHDGESAPATTWRKAMEAGDLAALATLYDAASVAFPPDQTEVTGAQAIMRGYARLFARYTVSVRVEDAHWTVQPPLVVSWGLTTLTLHPKAGGTDQIQRTRFTDAAVATGGGWLYLVDHASMPSAK